MLTMICPLHLWLVSVIQSDPVDFFLILCGTPLLRCNDLATYRNVVGAQRKKFLYIETLFHNVQ